MPYTTSSIVEVAYVNFNLPLVAMLAVNLMAGLYLAKTYFEGKSYHNMSAAN